MRSPVIPAWVIVQGQANQDQGDVIAANIAKLPDLLRRPPTEP
jgi:hypothetical protein